MALALHDNFLKVTYNPNSSRRSKGFVFLSKKTRTETILEKMFSVNSREYSYYGCGLHTIQLWFNSYAYRVLTLFHKITLWNEIWSKVVETLIMSCLKLLELDLKLSKIMMTYLMLLLHQRALKILMMYFAKNNDRNLSHLRLRWDYEN